MPFKEYDEFSAGPMRLPIRGKVYEIPEMSYEAGLRMQQVQAGTAPDISVEEQWRLVMGSAYDEMVADNVPAQALERAILACLTDYRLGREMAEQVWEVGVDPEAFAPKGADSAATTEADSTSTGEATTTKTPASTTGTTSPKGSTRAKAPKASPSKKRSPTGT